MNRPPRNGGRSSQFSQERLYQPLPWKYANRDNSRNLQHSRQGETPYVTQSAYQPGFVPAAMPRNPYLPTLPNSIQTSAPFSTSSSHSHWVPNQHPNNFERSVPPNYVAMHPIQRNPVSSSHWDPYPPQPPNYFGKPLHWDYPVQRNAPPSSVPSSLWGPYTHQFPNKFETPLHLDFATHPIQINTPFSISSSHGLPKNLERPVRQDYLLMHPNPRDTPFSTNCSTRSHGGPYLVRSQALHNVERPLHASQISTPGNVWNNWCSYSYPPPNQLGMDPNWQHMYMNAPASVGISGPYLYHPQGQLNGYSPNNDYHQPHNLPILENKELLSDGDPRNHKPGGNDRPESFTIPGFRREPSTIPWRPPTAPLPSNHPEYSRNVAAAFSRHRNQRSISRGL